MNSNTFLAYDTEYREHHNKVSSLKFQQQHHITTLHTRTSIIIMNQHRPFHILIVTFLSFLVCGRITIEAYGPKNYLDGESPELFVANSIRDNHVCTYLLTTP